MTPLRREARVVVVGAGVAGLTPATVLAEAAASVYVLAEQVPGVTSLAAGAMWGPYLVEPKDKVAAVPGDLPQAGGGPVHGRPAHQRHRDIPHGRGATGLVHHPARLPGVRAD